MTIIIMIMKIITIVIIIITKFHDGDIIKLYSSVVQYVSIEKYIKI